MTTNLVLVTGGTGKTGRRVVERLTADGVQVRVASRHANTPSGVVFDWSRPETWERSLNGVRSVYLVAPPSGGDASGPMMDFVQQGIRSGVQRYALLSASLLPAGGPAMGQVHLWLRENAKEWAVLRPSWFMENFSEGQHLATIREDGAIYSATGEGKVPFISAEDIAASAAAVLTADQAPNADYILTGPEAITYDDVAASLSQASGRSVVHKHLSGEELAERLKARGLPPAAAQMLASMDAAIAGGMENRTTTCVRDLTAAEPTAFANFAQRNRSAWSA